MSGIPVGVGESDLFVLVHYVPLHDFFAQKHDAFSFGLVLLHGEQFDLFLESGWL